MILHLPTLLVASFLILSGCDARTASSQALHTANLAEPAPAIALTGRVIDAANLLDPTQEAALSAKLEAFEKHTNHQMVIVTAASLGERDIEEFTRDLGNHWGIGRKQEDDGVVLLVAPRERKVRIAVGFGLEKTLTPEVCSQIINARMLSRFRNGEWAGGIDAGTADLIRRLS